MEITVLLDDLIELLQEIKEDNGKYIIVGIEDMDIDIEDGSTIPPCLSLQQFMDSETIGSGMYVEQAFVPENYGFDD